MTDRKITSWLLLKDLPWHKAFRVTDGCRLTLGGVIYTNKFGLDHPDFFLPIYEGEEVCQKCKGAGIVPYGVDCPTCHGQRKIVVNPEKPKCRECNGEWEWPPVEQQEVWFLSCGKIVRAICNSKVEGFGEFTTVDNRTLYIDDVFPIREMAEDYLKWRKNRRI